MFLFYWYYFLVNLNFFFISFNNLNNLSISDIENLLERNLFGFIEVEVDCPENITHPLLQIRRLVSNNLRTFAPVGNFKGWLHTEEIFEGMKLGYKFTYRKFILFHSCRI